MIWRLGNLMSVMLAFQMVAVDPARAQLPTDKLIDHEGDTSVRGFHGSGSPSRVRRSFQSDGEARAELDRILKAVGLNWIGDRIALRASAETANAEAGISKKGDRFIFYNATFMQKLKERTAEQWALVSVLAHELGHHVAFHTELEGNDHKYELEADYFSGFVLRRLGATLDQSHAAMRAISPKEATKTHPGLDQRLQVITIGWTDGGSQGAPRGLKERAADQPSPTAAVGPSVVPDQTGEFERSRRYPAPLSIAEEAKIRPFETFRECHACPEMAVIRLPANWIPVAQKEGIKSDVSSNAQRSISVGVYEVTFDEWDTFLKEKWLGYKPRDEGWGRGRMPVINVAWSDADEYIKWISSKTGKRYRLLDESEWEYVARASQALEPKFGAHEIRSAVREFVGNLKVADKTQIVGNSQPNAFGLFDLHGNVWEWTNCHKVNPIHFVERSTPRRYFCQMSSDGTNILRVVRRGYLDVTQDFLNSLQKRIARERSVYEDKFTGFRLARDMLQH